MAEPFVRRRCPGWKLEPRTCAVCSTVFKRAKRGNDAGLCCSRECGFILIRWRGEQSRNYYEAKAEFARWARRAKVPPKPIPVIRACSSCGASVDKFKQLCSDCHAIRKSDARKRARVVWRKSEIGRARRRADKAARKAHQRGAIDGSEKFDPLEVLARDGWRCHICGISTPKRLRGTYHDQAPELDHIVPLASGGKHTRLNTACACRRCNLGKADKPLGQLRLVA